VGLWEGIKVWGKEIPRPVDHEIGHTHMATSTGT